MRQGQKGRSVQPGQESLGLRPEEPSAVGAGERRFPASSHHNACVAHNWVVDEKRDRRVRRFFLAAGISVALLIFISTACIAVDQAVQETNLRAALPNLLEAYYGPDAKNTALNTNPAAVDYREYSRRLGWPTSWKVLDASCNPRGCNGTLEVVRRGKTYQESASFSTSTMTNFPPGSQFLRPKHDPYEGR